MVDVLVSAVVISGFVLLGVSAARHAHWREVFVAQLKAQGMWEEGTEAGVAMTVTILEAAIGAGGVMVLSLGLSFAAVAPFLIGAMLLGMAFVFVQIVLLVRHPDAPCGCDPGRDAQVGPGTLLKAAWPAVAGVVGLLALPTNGLNGLSIAAACVAVGLGLALAWGIDSVPVLFDRVEP